MRCPAPKSPSTRPSRTLQPSLERSLGQPIVIENRPGAGGAIGVEAVAKAARDGYVIGIAGLGALAVDVILNDKLPYDPFKDIAPISGLTQSPFILAAPLAFPGNSIADVISFAKSNPAARLGNEADVARHVQPFHERSVRLALSLASQAAVAYENRKLYYDIQTLFEGFVKAAVTAI